MSSRHGPCNGQDTGSLAQRPTGHTGDQYTVSFREAGLWRRMLSETPPARSHWLVSSCTSLADYGILHRKTQSTPTTHSRTTWRGSPGCYRAETHPAASGGDHSGPRSLPALWPSHTEVSARELPSGHRWQNKVTSHQPPRRALEIGVLLLAHCCWFQGRASVEHAFYVP